MYSFEIQVYMYIHAISDSLQVFDIYCSQLSDQHQNTTQTTTDSNFDNNDTSSASKNTTELSLEEGEVADPIAVEEGVENPHRATVEPTKTILKELLDQTKGEMSDCKTVRYKGISLSE